MLKYFTHRILEFRFFWEKDHIKLKRFPYEVF